MVKECKVILNNDALTVVRYDDKDIQFPAIGRKAATVKVLMTRSGAKIVSDDYKEYQPKKYHYRKELEESAETVETEY